MPNCSDNLFFIGQPMASKTCSTSDIKMEFGTQCHSGPVQCPTNITARPKRSDIREQLKDYVLLMLGAPVIRIELDPQQLDLAVDQALKVVEEWAPREFFQYYVFQTNPGQSVYQLPADVGHVRNVFFRTMSQPSQTASDLGGSIPLEFMYGSYSTFGFLTPNFPIWGDASSFVLYKQYEQMYNRVSSSIGGWEFLGDERTIKLYPIPCFAQQAIVHYIQKCKDWNDVLISMQEGSLIYAKEMLGRIRSKFSNGPGPAGGVMMDGQQLLQEAQQDKQLWLTQLLWRFGDIAGASIG